jgi:hypothetical protein
MLVIVAYNIRGDKKARLLSNFLKLYRAKAVETSSTAKVLRYLGFRIIKEVL